MYKKRVGWNRTTTAYFSQRLSRTQSICVYNFVATKLPFP
nr:MAG TPA: hypothetical protein [Caudoviricetes sp.]